MDFDYTTETITPDSTNVLTIGGTGGLEIPVGSTAQRPVDAVEGALRYNTDTNNIEGYYGTWVDIVKSSDTRLSTAQVIRVNKNPGIGEYSSIVAAMESITDNSTAKPYMIDVGPGVFTENQIVVKPSVTVQGAGLYSTIIQSAEPGVDLIIGAQGAGVTDCFITGATGVGSSLIKLDTASIQTSFICTNVGLGAAYRLVHVARGSLQLSNILFGGVTAFTQGFLSENSTTGSRLVLRNIFSTRLSEPYPEYLLKVSGQNAFCVIAGLFNRARGSNVPVSVAAGTGIWARDGAQIRGQAISVLGYDKGLWIENAGAAPFVELSSCVLEANVQDIVNDHPASTGSFTGSANATTSIDLSPDYTYSFVDNANKSINIIGDIFIGNSIVGATNSTDLIQVTTGTGILFGGVITQALGALDINISSGAGYLSDAVTKRSKRFEWAPQTVTLPDNQFSYVYILGTGAIGISTTAPSYTETLILGVVFTRAGIIERLIAAAYDAVHSVSKIDYYLRSVIGPVVTAGLVTTEGTADRQLSVTAGQAAYSILTFDAPAGTDITFEANYHQSGAFTYQGGQTVVSNTQYDNGTNLTALTPGYYTKHTLYVASYAGVAKYYLVYGQAEYEFINEVETAPLPLPPPTLTVDVIPVAAIIVRQGAGPIQGILDIRPSLGSSGQTNLSPADHGSLLGLTADNHPQYLLTSGVRAMSGDLNMAGFDIGTVGLINGVDVRVHAARHAPNGVDAIPTSSAVSLSPASINSPGVNNSLSRSDHTHEVTGFQAADATLSALSAYNTNGLLTQTAPDTFVGRAVAGTASRISVTNGTGTAGNPTVDIDATYVGQTSITTLGNIVAGTWNGTAIAATRGGTGQTVYTVGDILYASSTTALAKLPSIASGNALLSGGLNTAPLWGKIGLTTHVSGVLGLANGGTGLTATPTNGQIDIGNGTGFTRTTITAGAGITVTNGPGSITLSAAGGSGSVTSVALDLPSIFTVSGSPVTTAGTLTGTLNAQSPNTLLAGPVSGVAATPSFRTIGLGELNNVVLSAPSGGQALVYNGANWVNTSVPNSSATGTIGVSPTAGGTAWTLISGNTYRADFVHNLGTTNLVITVYDTNTGAIVTPQLVVPTTTTTVRVTVVGNTRTLKVVAIANGQVVALGGTTPSAVITSYEGATVSPAATRLNFRGQAVAVTDAGTGTTDITIGSRFTFFAASLDTPVNSDFALNSLSPMVTDPAFASLNVRAFSNTVEQGVAYLVSIPTGATTMTMKIRGRAQTAPGVASVVQPRLYYRLLPNNGAVGAWSTARELANIAIPTNANFQYGQQTILLSTLGLAAGNLYQMQLTRRIAGVTGTNLASPFLLAELTVEFA